MKDISKRIISSIILTPLSLFFIFQGSYFFNLFLLFCFLISCIEWYKMVKNKFNLTFGLIFLLLSFYTAFDIRNDANDDGLLIILFLILVSVTTDIGGFIFGKTFKGPKLTKISPNKTYAGMIGSFILSILISIIYINYFLSNYFSNFLRDEYLIILVFILSLVSQIGDIIVSYFKRISKIDNTGKLIPGHGGILDELMVNFCYTLFYVLIFFWNNMKQTIAILGSTGSIGGSLLNIIKRDRKNFQIILLSANKNYKKLFKQASYFNVKNLIISDKKVYDKLIKSKKLKNIKLYNSFNDFDKILKSKKIDYIMSAITGIEGLNPTLNIIKYTKNCHCKQRGNNLWMELNSKKIKLL